MLHRECATSGCGTTRQLRRAPRDYESAVSASAALFSYANTRPFFSTHATHGLTAVGFLSCGRALCIRCGRVARVEGAVHDGLFHPLEDLASISGVVMQECQETGSRYRRLPALSAFFRAVIRTAVGARIYRCTRRNQDDAFAQSLAAPVRPACCVRDRSCGRPWPIHLRALARTRPSQLQTVYVLDRSGIETTGKLLGLSPDSLVLLVADAERRFDRADVARIQKRDPSRTARSSAPRWALRWVCSRPASPTVRVPTPAARAPVSERPRWSRQRACTQGSARGSMPSFVGARRSMPRRHSRRGAQRSAPLRREPS